MSTIATEKKGFGNDLKIWKDNRYIDIQIDTLRGEDGKFVVSYVIGENWGEMKTLSSSSEEALKEHINICKLFVKHGIDVIYKINPNIEPLVFMEDEEE